MKIYPWALFGFAVWTARAAVPPVGDGENLVYRVSWAVVPGAGRITVLAHAESPHGGSPMLRVVTETETRGLAKLILPFSARAESLFDAGSGALVSFRETSSTRGRAASHTLTFDLPRGRAEYRDTQPGGETRSLEMPPGDPTDLINCLLLARTWNLQPGQAKDALVFFEDEFFPVTVHAVRRESVRTGIGELSALLLEPRMEKSPPKGMFKRGSTVKVWIGQDPRRLPVQFQVQFKVGSGVATLSDYRPGAAARPPASRPGPAGQK